MKTITKTPKIIKRTILSLIAVVSFSSCEKETAVVERDFTSFLESYSISTSGRDYKLTYETQKDVSTNTSKRGVGMYDVFFFEEQGVPSKTHTQTYFLEKEMLEIDFVAEGVKLPVITIKDREQGSNLTGRVANGVTDLLASYSIERITNSVENTVLLKFEVAEGVGVTYDYNDELNVYEVHLTQGEANTETDYSQTYELTNEFVEIHFVNHRISTARTDSVIEDDTDRIPRIVVEHE